MRILAIALLAFCVHADAQVYRCEVEGKVNYSDAPCLGAKRVDVTPTQGASHWSGERRRGEDVRRDEFRRTLNEATRPLHGKSYEEMKPNYRRSANRLTPAEHAECGALDMRMKRLEDAEESASGRELEATQRQLLNDRQRYLSLKC